KLENMPGIGPGNVTVASAGTNPKVYTLTFQNALGGYDVPIATFNAISTGVSEVQTLTFANNPAGTFTLSYGNLTTAAITYNATPATLQTNIQNALNATLGPGNTAVVAASATSVTITFAGQLANTNIQQLVASGLSTSGNALVTTSSDGT